MVGGILNHQVTIIPKVDRMGRNYPFHGNLLPFKNRYIARSAPGAGLL